MDYFIIMIYLFFYRIKLHNAIIWFLFELSSKKIFFTQWVKTKFPFPLNVLSPIPSTKIPVPVDQIPFSHPYFRPIPVSFYPFRALRIIIPVLFMQKWQQKVHNVRYGYFINFIWEICLIFQSKSVGIQRFKFHRNILNSVQRKLFLGKSPGLLDFMTRLVNSIFNLSGWQVKFF